MAELLLHGATVLSMDPAIGDLDRADVHVRDGRIVTVAPRVDPDTLGPDHVRLELGGQIVLPGLIDAHRHLWQSLLPGVAADWTLAEYMLRTRALQAGCLDATAAYLAALVGGLDCLAAGVTTVVDHDQVQASPEITEAALTGLHDSGVGGVFCYGLQNVPDHHPALAVGPPDAPVGLDTDAVVDALTRPADAWHDTNAARARERLRRSPAARLRFGVALPDDAPYRPTDELEAMIDRAQALDPALLTAHWQSAGPGNADALARRIDGPTLLVHGNGVPDDELAALTAAGAAFCSTPQVEASLGSGPGLALGRGLRGRTTLGSDIPGLAPAGMLEQARTALLLARSRGTATIPARRALELVTVDAARALGAADVTGVTGTVTPGARADLIALRPDATGSLPAADPVTAALFAATPAHVSTVVVAGHVAKSDGTLLGADGHTTPMAAAGEARDRLVRDLGRLPVDDVRDACREVFGA